MAPRHRMIHRVAALVVASVLVLAPVLPAFADDTTSPAPVAIVAAGVTVCGIDVSGMTAAEASAAVAAGYTMPAFAPITVEASGTVFVVDPAPAVSLDLQGLIADALAATAPLAIAPRYVVDRAVLNRIAGSIAAGVNVAPVNSTRIVMRWRLRITASRPGRALDSATTVANLLASLDSEIAANGSRQETVTAPVVVVQPRVTAANIGKTILVVLRERYLYYYSGATLIKKYRCAIGMPGHSTPTGHWKVVRKAALPSWHNPGSAWAAKMPATIRSGFYNPLGLRALYLNAPGIRIHGTSKTYSMGRAASHGCIRLTNKNVVDLYPRIPVGTPVWVVK